ncbi:restriction endonuclease [Solibacillus merdavium]|uniref:Restriction endonuclease n=1 Tax=Solibacillus merdavium TaxID=2762218 RepID=A0ABR8XLW8_9BACL|nr:restriction endonuclease [Solibacillus merdavium]MBD8032904.1 restriction endonuclease [Solibacillus merdavium]
MTKWWMVRAGDNNELIPVWLRQKIVSIGWPDLENPKLFTTKEQLLSKADLVYSEEKPQTRNSWVSQVWRFSREIEIGDRIISYSKEKREYIIGSVTEAHYYDYANENPYPNTLKVKWEANTVARDQLSQSAKNSLGSVLTVFRVDQWGSEIEGLLANPSIVKNPDVPPEDDETVIIEDLKSKARLMIEDKVDKLDPWQLQDLVGGLLQAMKYNVKISPKGPDGGVDILAYKDAFGFEQPIIKVQVKHRKSTAGSPEIQQLLGANPLKANCLFVSTGGFTSQAMIVAKQNSVKLVDLEELVQLIIEWYELMPNDTRALLPLQKMYVPE